MRGFQIGVVGTGYVGLTTGACLADLGHDVVCIDIDEERIVRLTQGETPILEEGLPRLVREGIAADRLRFTTSYGSLSDREFIFLCVPTPQAPDGTADLSFVEAAARSLGEHLAGDSIVINKSTVPVGSTRVVEKAMGRNDVHVVSNPEFLREGTAVSDFLHPDRIVIGSDDQVAADRVASIYASLSSPLIVTDPSSAELIKYASNAFLATKISFVNAIAAVSEAVGADVADVVKGLGWDHRIGQDFLRPGPGWGGSCFPKDTHALIRIAADAGYEFSLLEGVVEVNTQQFNRVVTKVDELVGDLRGAKIAAWGLTFKALTDDLRDSPAIEIIRRLVDRGASVTAFDPAVDSGTDITHGCTVVDDPYHACTAADALVVLTEWADFQSLDLERVAAEMQAPRIVDARNLLDREALRHRGFEFRGVGRC